MELGLEQGKPRRESPENHSQISMESSSSSVSYTFAADAGLAVFGKVFEQVTADDASILSTRHPIPDEPRKINRYRKSGYTCIYV